MWVVVSTSEFGDTFVIGTFDTEEQAVEALNFYLYLLEDATKSLGHEYKITRDLLFGDNDVIFEDDNSEDGDIKMEVREVIPFNKSKRGRVYEPT